MARISLRSYNREIENLIERGQIEEAIAHSKNVLKQYPKHIETYRLLGKAYLESQRYSEASDILQRVLSVVPDDFVAQLGMSIIREDEGNLDAAIWHMERAYEVQPFNRAVQDELRRLYGRRDGAEPPRVRLTRGSLVRMYVRGELYSQAIAEIRAALGEDPHRLDLMVLLARMYFLAGQKVESAEIASNLISKLPYCMEANRILMDILPGTNRAEEARGFQRRVFDLDPYAEYVTPNTPTSPQVPEQNVMVERVDWRPSAQENQSPDWARTIGVSWEKETEEEALPDWLDTLASGPSVPARTASEPAPSMPPSEEMVPDFLRSAGWGLSEGGPEAAVEPVTFEEDTAEPLENTEIPAWLQSMAPAVDTASQDNEPEKLDWLNAILPAGSISSSEDTINTVEPPVEDSQTEDISLDWLQAAEDQTLTDSHNAWSADTFSSVPEPISEEHPADSQIPDWLRELGSETSPDQPGQSNDSGDVPAWLRETSMGTDHSMDAAPDWTSEIEQPETRKSTGELPAWMQDEASGPSAVENLPDWLKEDPGSTEASLDETTTDSFGELPGDTEPALTDSTNEDLSVWLSQLGSTEAEDASSTGTEPSGQVVDQFAAGQELTDLTQESVTIPSTQDAIILPENSVGEITPPPSSVPDLNDMDAAMAWMEALAAKQGADSESLKITSPDQRSEDVPEWIADLGDGEPSTPELPLSAAEAELSAADASENEVPEWLGADLASTALTDSSEPQDQLDLPEAEIDQANLMPEWLSPPVEITSTDLPEEGAASAQIIEDTQPVKVKPVEGVPAAEEKPAEISHSPAEMAEPDFNDMDATMAWLEALAARQGAEPDSLRITSPEQRSETPPGWIAEISRQQPVAGEEPVQEEVIPDWLKDDSLDNVDQTPGPSAVEVSGDWISEFPSAFDGLHAEDQSAVSGVPGDAWPNEPISDKPIEVDETPPDSLPAWLIEEQTTPRTGTPVISTQPSTGIPSLDDMDSTMAWLEALAAKQGADLESLKITSPDRRSTTPPDWIAELSKQSGDVPTLEDKAPIQPPAAEEISIEPETFSTPAAGTALEAEPIQTQAMSEPVAAETPVSDPDIPTWLLNYEQEQAETKTGWEATDSATTVPTPISVPDDSITEWLKKNHPEPGLEPLESAEAAQSEPVQQSPSFSTPSDPLTAQAETALARGEVSQSLSLYSQLIETGSSLDVVIESLYAATDRYPVDANIWQTLGDAYIRADRIQEALDAYSKAEELLR